MAPANAGGTGAVASGVSAAEYAGGFVEHYLMPVLYPVGLTRGVQYLLGATVVLVNAAVYWQVFRRVRRDGRGTRDRSNGL